MKRFVSKERIILFYLTEINNYLYTFIREKINDHM